MNTLASIVSGEPPINPPPLSIEAQRISRINIELLEDSFITNEKISSLTTQIEQCLAVLVSQSARIHGLKGQLDSSQAECTSLRSRLAEKTKLANAYNRRIRVLEKDLSSVEEVMATLRAKLRDAKARLDALRRCVAILYAEDKKLRTELHTRSRDFVGTSHCRSPMGGEILSR